MKPIISVEGLGKSYTIRHEGQTHYKSLREEFFKLPKRLLRKDGQSREEFWALRDVNFDIMPGDRVGIIGRNGAGKSTLLKLLSRITEPTTGRITLRGRVASLLEVGTGFHPELTGRENIFLNGAILGMSRAEVRRKFDEIVDFAGVERFLDTPVKRYSSGMYVRLAFAVAAHLEPEILIVDEVLAVGDAEFQKKCLGKMEDVGREGRTVLFVSHNMGMISKICTTGILIESSTIKALGEIRDVISCYNQQSEVKSASVHKDIASVQNLSFIMASTVNGDGQEKAEYWFDETIAFHVKIFAPNGLENIEFTLGLLDASKNRIFNLYEDINAYPVVDGILSLLITFPKELVTPGKYSWTLAIHTFGVQLYDRLDDVCFFSVLDTGSKYGRYPLESYGAICPPYFIEPF